MRPYGQILSKISPTLYKFVQYEEYFDNRNALMGAYFAYAKFPDFRDLNFLTKDIFYYYDSDYAWPHYLFGGKLSTNITIKLGTENNSKPTRNSAYPTTLITNMILNKFSFENKHFIPARLSSSTIALTNFHTVKNAFIAMVGRDMYDTIRTNIK